MLLLFRPRLTLTRRPMYFAHMGGSHDEAFVRFSLSPVCQTLSDIDGLTVPEGVSVEWRLCRASWELGHWSHLRNKAIIGYGFLPYNMVLIPQASTYNYRHYEVECTIPHHLRCNIFVMMFVLRLVLCPAASVSMMVFLAATYYGIYIYGCVKFFFYIVPWKPFNSVDKDL